MNNIDNNSNDLIPSNEGKFDNEIEYVRLTKVAKILKCDIDDLLHLGATGKLPIIASVVAKGEYEWLNSAQVTIFQPGITGSLRRIFGPKDRVLLSKDDIAEIEAIGFVIPHSFHSKKETQKILKEKKLSNLREKYATFRVPDEIPLQPVTLKKKTKKLLPESTETDRDWPRRAFSQFLEADKVELEPDRGLFGAPKFLHLVSLNIPWKSVNLLTKDDGVTTKEHLFISKIELDRLQQELVPSPNEGVQIKEGLQKSLTEIINPEIPLSKEFNKSPMPHAVQTEKGSLKKNERNNVLTEVIERAIAAAAPSTSMQVIWGKFVEMAESDDPFYPLSTYEGGDVKYEKNGHIASLNYKNFTGRVARQIKKKK